MDARFLFQCVNSFLRGSNFHHPMNFDAIVRTISGSFHCCSVCYRALDDGQWYDRLSSYIGEKYYRGCARYRLDVIVIYARSDIDAR